MSKEQKTEHKFSVTFVSKVGTIITNNDSCNCHMKWQLFKNNHSLSGLVLVFSCGGGVSKKIKIFVDLFVGRANCFLELFQSTINTLFWLIFLRCSQNFGKTGQKFWTFWTIWDNLRAIYFALSTRKRSFNPRLRNCSKLGVIFFGGW